LDRDKHTCIAYFAKSNNRSKEKDVIQSNQDVHVCEKFLVANLILLCSLKHISLYWDLEFFFLRTWDIFILIFLLFYFFFLIISFFLSFSFYLLSLSFFLLSFLSSLFFFLFLSIFSLSLSFYFLSFFFYDSLMSLFATKLFERDINKDLEDLF
jgi:hypothetical protein